MQNQERPRAKSARSLLLEFLHLESAGGLVLMAAAVLALVVANSPLSGAYDELLDVPVQLRIGALDLHKPLILWINDGLMAVFFFLVGMELKREMAEGHLSSLRSAALPAFAALGGILVPAGIYFLFNRGDEAAVRGWAIPTATDIAFALGVLSLLGSRVPSALKAFLLSVAIFDDLAAIVLIALLYTTKLSGIALAIAGALIVVLLVLNRLGVRMAVPYVLIGIPLWVAVLKSGLHATIAGVILAMFIPLRAPADSPSLLRKLEHDLHPFVAFGVLPIFAFTNAGVSLTGLSLADMVHPVPLGILLGLFLGKQVGILALSWLAVRFGLAALPGSITWRQLHAIAVLCGIGFTMSLFIASLAFDEATDLGGLERLGILLGTLVSGLVGYFALRRALGRGDAPA
ncbi:MAG TPA: Na+/H+ antiporter NhaA [Planctomycetes bacterium]|nr:Na+/H+ antiporter NhaA [Planctomycetota bacterium]